MMAMSRHPVRHHRWPPLIRDRRTPERAGRHHDNGRGCAHPQPAAQQRSEFPASRRTASTRYLPLTFVCKHGCEQNTFELIDRLGLRSTFMRIIAPSHDASRNVATSSASRSLLTSPAACAARTVSAKASVSERQISVRCLRSTSLCSGTSRLMLPTRHPYLQPASSSHSAIATKYARSRSLGWRL